MTSNAFVSIKRKFLLVLTEGVIKLLWFVDKVTSLDVDICPRHFLSFNFLFIFRVFSFIGYSMRTGYLSNIVYEKFPKLCISTPCYNQISYE